MATLVGTQKNFKDAVKELIELDYDAVEAYKTAIDKLENLAYKNKLEDFKKDHERHISELSRDLIERGENAPKGPDIGKLLLAKGKVLLANLVGDNAILEAMKSNEIDTKAAYERMYNRPDKWESITGFLKRGVEDEKRHKAWLEENIKIDQ